MELGTTLGRIAFGRATTEPEVQVNLRPGTMFAARAMMSLIFIASGTTKIFTWNETMAFMSANGLVRATGFLLFLVIVVEVVGGLSVLTGTVARVGALMLFLYLIPTTLVFHDFWTFTGPERQMQMINFFKNLAIMGGLLAIVASGPGVYSIDRSLEVTTRANHA